MRKLNYLLFLLIFCSGGLYAQSSSILIFEEFFELAPHEFSLNQDLDSATTGFGTNEWIINADYTGAAPYPNTLSQDSTVSGIISNAPFSSYLHITDGASATGNAVYDPGTASRNFAVSDNYCTLGYKDVKFRFFWLAEGDSSDYGEVYYSKDGGLSWSKTGRGKYNAQRRWRFEEISDTAFEDVEDLRFAFAWNNDGTGSNQQSAFSIDDIFLVATADTLQVSIDSFFNDSICVIATPNFMFLNFYVSMSEEICASDWELEVSYANGQFGDGVLNPRITLSDMFFSGDLTNGQLRGTNLNTNSTGSNLPTGNNYRLRLRRLSPSPQVVSSISPPFTIYNCPNVIAPITTPEVFDNPSRTACLGDDIDIRFRSSGVFGANNQYMAILSDSNGNFNNGDTIQRFFDQNAYSNFPWNRFTGKLPTTAPPACGYFIRLIATDPYTENAATTLLGPFCLANCPGGGSPGGGGGGGLITDTAFIGPFCIPEDTTLRIINTIDFPPGYPLSFWTDNDFSFRVHDRDFFGTIRYFGGPEIKVTFDTTLGAIIYEFGPGSALRPLLPMGDYYGKIVGFGGAIDSLEYSSWFRFQFSYPPSPDTPEIFIVDSFYCNNPDALDGAVAEITIRDFEPPPVTFNWVSPSLNNGNPLPWDFNPLRVTVDGFGPGFLQLQVFQTTPYCPINGPVSAELLVPIIGPPTATVDGPIELCQGDTGHYFMESFPQTTYNWGLISEGIDRYIVENNSDNIKLLYDTSGTFTYTVESLNKCGASGQDQFTVNVNPPMGIAVSPPDTVCQGEPASFDVVTDTLDKRDTGLLVQTDTLNADTFRGIMFDIEVKEEFYLQAITTHLYNDEAGGYQIWRRDGGHVGFENDPFAWTNLYGRTIPADTVGYYKDSLPFEILFEAGKRYGIYLVQTSGDNSWWHANGPNLNLDSAISDNSVMTMYEASRNAPTFLGLGSGIAFDGIFHYRTTGSITYEWSPVGLGSRTIDFIPDSSSQIVIRAFDPQNCEAYDTTAVVVNPVPLVTVPGDTSACASNEIVLEATTSVGSPAWYGPDGAEIAASTTLSIPALERENDYVFLATDLETGCTSGDTVVITGLDCSSPVKVPNALAPAASDPSNRYWSVFVDKTGLAEIEVHIFNRWGERVYFSTDMNDVGDFNTGWDGTHYQTGKPQPMGVYVYYVKATFDFDDLVVEKKGNITLIR